MAERDRPETMVNSNELEDFYHRCPRLFHMAMDGSWPLISEIGLLNTETLLNEFGVKGELRVEILSKRRPTCVSIDSDKLGTAIVRDQIPLLDSDLDDCLLDGLTRADWHKRLNERVFFWTNEKRLNTLMSARAYRNLYHHVIEVDTKNLVEAYSPSIELSPMNSGCTRPWKHKRGKSTFLPISHYPYADRVRKSPKDDAIVELTVLGGIPDVLEHTLRVTRRRCGQIVETIYER